MVHYDLLVIGTGPAGQKAAVQAAKLGKKVGIIERKEVVGGVSTNTGTIPSKALREAVLYLAGFRQRTLYGAEYRLKKMITIEDLAFRANRVIKNEIEIVQDQMARNGIDLIYGEACFIDPHRLHIKRAGTTTEHRAHVIVIAVGTEPARPAEIPFDEDTIIDTDGLLTLKHLPTSMVIVGGGVIGTEYASILAMIGVPVILIDKRPRLLEFVDAEIIVALQKQMAAIGVTIYHDRYEALPSDSLRLEEMKRDLSQDIDRTVHTMQDEATIFADPNDRASQESDMSLELRNRDRERKLIKKIDETISRIDLGEYGYCESCGVEIGLKRLEARPTATLCIDCKTLDEMREKQVAK